MIKAGVVYLLGLVPAGVTLTGLTTQLGFNNLTDTFTTYAQSGPINIATAGLATPALNAARTAAGTALTSLGHTVGSEDLQATGATLKNKAKEWFHLGSHLSATKIKDEAVKIVERKAADSPFKPDASHNESDSTKAWFGKVYRSYREWIDNMPYEFQRQNKIDGDIDNYSFSPTNWAVNYDTFWLEINEKADIDVAAFPQPGEITYGQYDEKGRTTEARATLTYENYYKSLKTRDTFKEDPVGWPAQNPKVTIHYGSYKTYHGYFWNRSHLIGDALGGAAIPQNAITGTRAQNVGQGTGGMRYPESTVEKYFKKHGNLAKKVYYSAKPVYFGDEKIPRSVLVRAYSEDEEVNLYVEVFNVAPGYTIDYNNATFTEVKN